MKRRDFILKAGAGSLAAGAALTGCGKGEQAAAPGAVAKPQTTVTWKMVTTWPKNFPGLGTGANKLAELIGQMSGGRITVKVYGAGELVPPFEIFDAVSNGVAELGHGAAYLHQMHFFSALAVNSALLVYAPCWFSLAVSLAPHHAWLFDQVQAMLAATSAIQPPEVETLRSFFCLPLHAAVIAVKFDQHRQPHNLQL